MKGESQMNVLRIIVIVVLAINIILPFLLSQPYVSSWINSVGWSLALMWFCVAAYT